MMKEVFDPHQHGAFLETLLANTRTYPARQQAARQAFLRALGSPGMPAPIQGNSPARQLKDRQEILQILDSVKNPAQPHMAGNNLFALGQKYYPAFFDALAALAPSVNSGKISTVAKDAIVTAYLEAKRDVLGEYPPSIRNMGDLRNAFRQARKALAFRWKAAGEDDAGNRVPLTTRLNNLVNSRDADPLSPSYRESKAIYRAARQKIVEQLDLIR